MATATNGNAMKGLDADFIAELMAKGRSKNTYGPKLAEFMESDEAAINPADVWPLEFGKKEATSLYQGFLGAAKKAGLQDQILVKKVEDSCFLLHKERVSLLVAASDES